VPRPESQLVNDIAEIAREAGALLRDYFGRVAVEYKGEVDLVTEADRRSEALVVGRIKERWPGHDIMGEEGTRHEQGSEWKWYVDPLDGTTNFAHGFPVFCVSIGLERTGELEAGVVYDPLRDELFAAERGKGATLNGETIAVSQIAALNESLVGTGFPSFKRHQSPNIHFYHQITLRTHGVRRAGSAALDLACVASGRFEGFWEFNLNPWDVAAGVLLVREAGGQVTDMAGRPYDHRKPSDTLASNGRVHAALLAEFDAIQSGRDLEPLPSPAAARRQ
jgi:myo-inositol-1(or 4)-monophosphatase